MLSSISVYSLLPPRLFAALSVGGNVDGTKAVCPSDRGIATSFLGNDHLAEGNLFTAVSSNPHIGKVLQASTLFIGIANVNANFVPPALETLNLLSIECLPDLPGDGIKAQAEGLTFTGDCLLYTSPSPRD